MRAAPVLLFFDVFPHVQALSSGQRKGARPHHSQRLQACRHQVLPTPTCSLSTDWRTLQKECPVCEQGGTLLVSRATGCKPVRGSREVSSVMLEFARTVGLLFVLSRGNGV